MQFVGCILVLACSCMTDSYDFYAGIFLEIFLFGNSGLFDSVPPLRHDALADILCFSA